MSWLSSSCTCKRLTRRTRTKLVYPASFQSYQAMLTLLQTLFELNDYLGMQRCRKVWAGYSYGRVLLLQKDGVDFFNSHTANKKLLISLAVAYTERPCRSWSSKPLAKLGSHDCFGKIRSGASPRGSDGLLHSYKGLLSSSPRFAHFCL